VSMFCKCRGWSVLALGAINEEHFDRIFDGNVKRSLKWNAKLKYVTCPLK
jgi:hypothetical protein